jgi:membrane-bound metal-dependent hydrolase YbcI (DUF457 family)
MAAGMENSGVNSMSLDQGLQVVVPASIPWSHGLFMSVIWSVVAAAIAYLVFRDRQVSGILGSVVFSHWVLDSIVHPGELPLLFSGSPTVGLGLWTSGPGLILSGILEIGLLAGGIAIYLVTRKQKHAQEYGQ